MASGATLNFLHPYANEPPSSNYAVADLRNLHPILDFDDTTAWAAVFTAFLPRNYSGGGITVTAFWTAVATTGTVGWTVEIERMDVNSLDIDADSFGPVQTITAVNVDGTSGKITGSSVAISSGANMDGLVAGEMYRLRIKRDVANDTAVGNAQLLGIEVKET